MWTTVITGVDPLVGIKQHDLASINTKHRPPLALEFPGGDGLDPALSHLASSHCNKKATRNLIELGFRL